MIHPSYVELMKVVNNDVAIGEEPVVNSRYSIVIASAKRARQIIAGAEPMIPNAYNKKPLSTAVEELYEGKVKILGEDDGELELAEAEQTENENLESEAEAENEEIETADEENEENGETEEA